MNQRVTIHTDGACSGNPGPGGYGVVLRMGENRKELSGGFRLTTNNPHGAAGGHRGFVGA